MSEIHIDIPLDNIDRPSLTSGGLPRALYTAKMDDKKDHATEVEDATHVADRGLENCVSPPSPRYMKWIFMPCSFTSSSTQLVLAALVCFCCPGI